MGSVGGERREVGGGRGNRGEKNVGVLGEEKTSTRACGGGGGGVLEVKKEKVTLCCS